MALVRGMIIAGSVLMLLNIIYYFYFIRTLGKRGIWTENKALLYFALTLLVLFLIGYVLVGIFSDPDLIVSSILLGGSVFVSVIVVITHRIANRIQQNEELRSELLVAKQASAAKSEFLSNMSHDIRTPLNAVIGYTELALHSDPDMEESRNYFRKISSSGRHLLDLVNDILEMSRIESGKIQVRPEPCDIVQGVLSTCEIFTQQMQEKGIAFHTEADVRERVVLCDRRILDRIIMNLVSNAYKFTPEGGNVNVRITQKEDPDEKNGLYEICVEDTGIGMSEAFMQRVFDSFEREQTSTVSGIQGTGLGMAITKRLTDLLNGTIRVESRQNEGSRFTVCLPFEKTQLEETDSTLREECEGCPDFSGRHVLVVDDVQINREIATLMLENMHITADSAQNGAEAVSKVKENRYDLILMDIQMPVMDGYEATGMIRKQGGYLMDVPIIALTANVFAEDVERAISAGMDGHLSKPIEPARLIETLKMYLLQ